MENNINRRVENKTISSVSDAGSKVEVHETWEEVVPMALKHRVTSKFAEVPVEIKTETFDNNGNVVDSKVEVLSTDMDVVVVKPMSDLDEIKNHLALIEAKIGQNSQSSTVMREMEAKYTVAEGDGTWNKIGSNITWLGVVLAAGGCAWFLMM